MSGFDFTNKSNSQILQEIGSLSDLLTSGNASVEDIKLQLDTVILSLSNLEGNTDSIETQLNSLISLTSSLVSIDYSKESTQLQVKSVLDAILVSLNTPSPSATLELNTDAGGRLRVSELTTLIDLKQLNDKLPLFFDEVIIGGGTAVYDQTNAKTLMSVTANNQAVIRQTKQRFNYQSGKSYLVFNTFDNFQPQTNVIKRVGYFNSNTVTPYDSNKDGIYIESSNNTIYTVVEKSGVITSKIAQANWNVDKLDGTGPSGITLDWSKGQVFVFDMLWLGKAGVRFYIELGDKLVLFHKESYANVLTEVYVSNPNHSIRYEIRSTGGTGSLGHVCSTVAVEGSRNETGTVRGFNNEITALNASTLGTTYVSKAIKLKTTVPYADIDLLTFSMLGTTNDNFIWKLILNPTIAGTLTYTPQLNSAVEIANGVTTNTLTGGTLVDNGYVSSSTSTRVSIENALKLGMSVAGVSDVFVLAVTPLSNGLQVFSSVTIREKL